MQYLIKIPLLLVALVPLIVDKNTIYPEVYGKVFYFSLLVLFSFCFFIIRYFKNQEFRKNVLDKVSFLKSKIFLSMTAFVGISLVSSIFAFDKYMAFWGTIERGDGFFSLLFLFIFLILLILNFEKKDWIWFFRLGLLATVLMLGKAFTEYAGGLTRPNSFIGNPAFLAGYFLYSVTSAFIVWKEDINKWWKYFAMVLLPFSFVGILLTQTRSAILGVLAGFAVCLVYLFLKGKNLKIKNISLQKISGILIALGLTFVLIFILTKNAPLWQKVPGLSRVADISIKDSTTSSRMLVWGMGFESVNPRHSLKEFLIGWGPENATYSLAKYYNPEIYKYDKGAFDKTHNRFIDVFVMSGIFALLSYILIWFFVFKKLFKNDKEFSWENTALIFFFASFFVHLLFVFDQIPTSITLFIFFSYALFIFNKNKKEENFNVSKILNILFVVSFLVLSFVFFRNISASYFQMRSFSKILGKNDLVFMRDNVSKILDKKTFAQGEVVKLFMKLTNEGLSEVKTGSKEESLMNQLFMLGIDKGEEYLLNNKKDFKFLGQISDMYLVKNSKTGKKEDLERAEYFLREALKIAPKRQDYNNYLATNLAYQKRFNEAKEQIDKTIALDVDAVEPYYYKGIVLALENKASSLELLDLFEKAFSTKPEFFFENTKVNTQIYISLLSDFYTNKDKENFMRVIGRLRIANYSGIDVLNQIAELIEKGQWPIIKFN